MTTSEQLLTLLLNSKKGGELPLIDSLKNADRIIVFDSDTNLVSTILKSNFVGASSGSSTKEIFTATDSQPTITLASKPDNINVVVNRVSFIQDIDYTYSVQTGVITFTTPLVLNSKVSVRGYQNAFSKKETLTVNSEGQTVFNLSEKPKNIDVNVDRVEFMEDEDYAYNSSTGALTFTSGVSLLSKITVRKIY